MKSIHRLFLLPLLFLSVGLSAQTVDEKINSAVAKSTGWFVEAIFAPVKFTESIQVPWVLIVLLLVASFFTLYFGFANIRYFKKAIQVASGKYEHLEEAPEGEFNGEVTHFQALTAALSATVGLGNIAGVAVALSLGGPGATFWMILAGFLGMSTKFVECTLGVKYREFSSTGEVFGGPMYYLEKGLSEKNMALLGKILAIVFCVMCVGGSFGAGNMFQANQAFAIFESITGAEQSFIHGKGWLFGLVLAILVGLVIVGGIKSIAKVTDKVVPFMVVMYVLACLVILIASIADVPQAISVIFESAFSGKAIAGGVFGVMIQGFKRAAFSNEAGIGSAPIAHAAVKTNYPASEGLVALLGPFIDTVVVCTMTALVIVVTNLEGGIMEYGTKTSDGVLSTSDAFASVIPWFPYLLAIAVILFAFSTMVSWSYYGYQAWSYLFGKGKMVGNIYRVIFCSMAIVGSAISLGAVIDLTDAMIFAMLVPNMIGVMILLPKVKEEVKKYLEKIS